MENLRIKVTTVDGDAEPVEHEVKIILADLIAYRRQFGVGFDQLKAKDNSVDTNEAIEGVAFLAWTALRRMKLTDTTWDDFSTNQLAGVEPQQDPLAQKSEQHSG